MTEEDRSRGSVPAGGNGAALENIDWVAAERSPEFRELVQTRRRFVVPCTVFFLGWYITFILLAGYAPEFMGESVYEGLTVGYVLALSQFVMVWGLGWLYLRKADRVFDPLAERAAQVALDAASRGAAPTEPARPASERPREEVAPR